MSEVVGRHVELGLPGGPWLALVLLVALGVLVVSEVRALRRSPGRARGALAALRVATALGAWLVAVQPQWVGERVRAVPGRLVVLADASASMGVTDADGARASRAAALAARWARDTEAAGRAAPLAFGATLRPTDWRRLAADWPAADDATRLGAALEAALDEGARARELGALVVVSDGRTDGAALPIGRLRREGITVHAVLVGEPVDDDAIVGVEADPVAFLRSEGRVRVAVRARGGEGAVVPVTLREARGEVVSEEVVELDAEGRGTAELAFVPRALGRAVYRVSIPVREGDLIPDNNERPFLVRVVREKLRVLHVVGAPSWDERFLRELLEKDPRVDLVSFFILRTTGDLTMAPSSDLALIPFPTDELFTEHLSSFDLVVFQNFDHRPYDVGQHLGRLRAYVEGGGGFAMVGGELAFGAAGVGETPLGSVLPVAVPPPASPEEAFVVEGELRPTPPEEAARHPVVELRRDVRENDAAWRALAPVPGANRFLGLRPGAQALLVHPSARTDAGGAMPVLAVGPAGEGRVLALGIDASYRWGFTTGGLSGDASAYERFWDRAIRWLTRDPTLEAARLRADRERYGPAARVAFEGLARDARYVPLVGGALRVVVRAASDTPLGTVEVVPASDGTFAGAVDAPATPGAYRLTLEGEGAGPPLAEEPFLVEAAGDELAEPSPDPTTLRRLAEATGGRYVARPGDAPGLDAFESTRVERLGVERRAPFAHPLALALVVALFLVEWALRRRAGRR